MELLEQLVGFAIAVLMMLAMAKGLLLAIASIIVRRFRDSTPL